MPTKSKLVFKSENWKVFEEKEVSNKVGLFRIFRRQTDDFGNIYWEQYRCMHTNDPWFELFLAIMMTNP